MMDTVDGPGSPVFRRVVVFAVFIDRSQKYAGAVEVESTGDDAIGSDNETGPGTVSRRGIVGADPEVIAGGIGLHRGWNGDAPDVVGVVAGDVCTADFGPGNATAAVGHVAVMVSVKNKLHLALRVLAV